MSLVRLVCLLACSILLWALPAQAGSIEPVRASVVSAEDGSALLTAEFAIDLGQRLEEAVTRGVTLAFVLEFEVTRPRWWWTNEPLVMRNVTYRLSYNALTQQYRIAKGNLHFNFATLPEALRLLTRIQLPLNELGSLKAGESYAAGVRLSLDRSQLPKPFQIDALANRDWQIDSRVLRWNWVPATPAEVKP